MLDVLQRRGESVTAIGVDAKGPIVEGNPSLGRTVDVISSGGLNTLNRRSLTDQSNDLAVIEDLMKYLNEETSLESGVFANYWAQNREFVLTNGMQFASQLKYSLPDLLFVLCSITFQSLTF